MQGKNVLHGLISAARDQKIKLRIVNNFAKVPSNDTVDLINAGNISALLQCIVGYRVGCKKAAAGLVTDMQQTSHRAILQSLHWLLVYRHHKLAVLVCKCLSVRAPAYIVVEPADIVVAHHLLIRTSWISLGRTQHCVMELLLPLFQVCGTVWCTNHITVRMCFWQTIKEL